MTGKSSAPVKMNTSKYIVISSKKRANVCDRERDCLIVATFLTNEKQTCRQQAYQWIAEQA